MLVNRIVSMRGKLILMSLGSIGSERFEGIGCGHDTKHFLDGYLRHNVMDKLELSGLVAITDSWHTNKHTENTNFSIISSILLTLDSSLCQLNQIHFS